MNKPLPVELLEKYLRGACTAEEAALVKQWYHSFKDQPGYVNTLDAAGQHDLEEKIYNRILDNISTEDTTAAPVVTLYTKKQSRWYKIGGIAAAFVIGAITLVFYTKNTSYHKHTAIDNAAPQVFEITNNSEKIHKSVLPDSSTVWLSPHASLRYPKVFEKQARMVTMAGDCFFEVTKNAKRPFIITSKNIITKVWGTSFLIRDNESRHTADVSVVTGKVSVSIKKKNNSDLLVVNKDEVILYPQQKVTFLTDKKVLTVNTTSNSKALKIWSHADLNFENKPLKDIVPILNATYNVNIKVTSEKINQFNLNADFSGLNLPDVLEALSQALGIEYALKSNTIELSKPTN
jgi:transmembrane sensor